ncbi:MAG: ankyrin repeat domain-containing protein [Nitrospinae bacterium]|nr:ankyrin repeat domain-containing protein [Nitrospinota bacterium]
MFDRFFATRTILILTLTFFLPAQVFSTHLDSRPPVQTPGPGLSVQAMDALRNPPERLSPAVKTELENALKKAADPVLRSFFRNIFDRRSYSVKVNHLRNTHGLHFSARGTSGGFLPTTILLEVFHKGGNEAVQNLYGVWFDPMNTSGGVKLYRFPSADRAALSSLKQRNAESFYWQKGEHYIEVQVGRGAVELAKKVHASAEANGFYNFPASIISGGPGSGGFITSRLLRAIESGNQFRVERIIQKGANVEGEPGQVTPLILAAELGRLEIINILLRAGAKPNTRGLGDINALVKAAENNHPLIVKKLINAGSETHVRDDRGATALAAAIKNGNANMLKDLLEAGADVNSSQIYEGERRLYRTPLMAAAGISWASNQERASEAQVLEAVTLLVEELGADVNVISDVGETAMHAAAYRGANSVVQYLFDQGAELDVVAVDGRTPLRVADGVEYGNSFAAQPHTAVLLRALGAQDIPCPAPCAAAIPEEALR